MAKLEGNTIIKKLEDTGLPYYLCKFVDWYLTDEEHRQKWEDLCNCDINYKTKQGENKTPEFCKENWLTRADVQEGIKVWLGHMKTLNTLKIYNTMMDKATKGDVQAAKWVQEFHESKFFDGENDEINDFLNQVNIKKPKKVRG